MPLAFFPQFEYICLKDLYNYTYSYFIFLAAYIKVYLLENGVCIAKKKTKSVRKSLDPLYNQVLVFSERPQGKVVQVTNIKMCVTL